MIGQLPPPAGQAAVTVTVLLLVVIFETRGVPGDSDVGVTAALDERDVRMPTYSQRWYERRASAVGDRGTD